MIKIAKEITYDFIKDLHILDIRCYILSKKTVGYTFDETFNIRPNDVYTALRIECRDKDWNVYDIVITKRGNQVESILHIVELDWIDDLEKYEGQGFYLYEIEDVDDYVVKHKDKVYLAENINFEMKIPVDECEFVEVKDVTWIART